LKSEAEIVRLVTAFIVDEVASTPPASPLMADDPIVESGLVDSLGLFKVISFIEDNLGVKIAPEDILLENFSSISAIVRLIRGKEAI